jgi:hypothetical protein
LKEPFYLIGELSPEFTTDPPCQAALAWAAFRQDDDELRGNVDIFGDYLHAAIRYVRDRAVTRQAGPELDPREPSAQTTFARTSIHQHVDFALLDNSSSGIPAPCSEELLESA